MAAQQSSLPIWRLNAPPAVKPPTPKQQLLERLRRQNQVTLVIALNRPYLRERFRLLTGWRWSRWAG